MSKALARTHCGSTPLAVSGRDVVSDRVAKDDVVGAVRGDILGEGLDDDGELGLVVDLLAPGGQDVGASGPMTEVLGLRKTTGSRGGSSSPISTMWPA